MPLTKWSFKKLYYDKKISVFRTASTNIRWSIKQTKVLIYDKVDCSFWEWKRQNFAPSWISALTDIDTYEANLKPENSDILRKDIVEVFYVNNWVDVSIWTYIVNNVLFNENYKWTLDNIELKLKSTTDVS